MLQDDTKQSDFKESADANGQHKVLDSLDEIDRPAAAAIAVPYDPSARIAIVHTREKTEKLLQQGFTDLWKFSSASIQMLEWIGVAELGGQNDGVVTLVSKISHYDKIGNRYRVWLGPFKKASVANVWPARATASFVYKTMGDLGELPGEWQPQPEAARLDAELRPEAVGRLSPQDKEETTIRVALAAYRSYRAIKQRLIERKGVLTYGELLDEIDVPDLDTRAARHILDVVSTTCRQNGMPDLACMVVNKATGLPGHGYDHTDWGVMMDKVLAYDWSKAKTPVCHVAVKWGEM